jgi:hypothetical protein
MNKIITAKEARELGLKFYFTGKPCKRGHVVKRRVIGRHCVACEKQRKDKGF